MKQGLTEIDSGMQIGYGVRETDREIEKDRQTD